jgi:hypothetical protein
MNYINLGKYLLVGVVSGLLCRFTYYDQEQWEIAGPALVLAAMILMAGRFISGIIPRQTFFSPLILLLCCAIGWFLAYEHGLNEGFYIWPAECGFIGGLFVGVGLIFAWRPITAWVIIPHTAVAGVLGGVSWILWDSLTDLDFPLFVFWQGILLLGIGIAVQVDSKRRSSGR